MTTPMCPTVAHDHDPHPPGCTFPSGRTRAGICDRTPSRAFIGARGIEFRCAVHDTAAAREAAVRMGYRPGAV